ncbi:hypothetical protein EJB05_30240, partial [Eragrostis curvula]
MGEAAAQIKRMKTELAEAPPHLTEDNHREILVRLPAKDVLHYGIFRELPFNNGWATDIALEALHASGDNASRRRLIRYPNTTRSWLLLAASDGVLLFRKDEGWYFLCNPMTKMWADLPRLCHGPLQYSTVDDKEYAFYFHLPSNQYRLLCRRDSSTNGTWCILSTGEATPCDIDTEAAEAAGITELIPCLRTVVTTPVALHSCLHWPPQKGAVTNQTSVVVFDMLSETFTKMAGPSTATDTLMKLFHMDGLLVGADFVKEQHIDLWFLESYGSDASWKLRHRVTMPGRAYNMVPNMSLLSMAAVADHEGNVMLGNKYGLIVYNVRRKTMKTIDSVATPNNYVVVSRHMFSANLVQHPHFGTQTS